MDVPVTMPSTDTRTWGGGIYIIMVCVHGHSLDVPVTMPSTDTRTWGGGIYIWCVSMDIPWMSQLLYHPWILGYYNTKTSVDDMGMSMAVLAISDWLQRTSKANATYTTKF